LVIKSKEVIVCDHCEYVGQCDLVGPEDRSCPKHYELYNKDTKIMITNSRKHQVLSYATVCRPRISSIWCICSLLSGPKSIALAFSSTCATDLKPGIGIVRSWRAQVQASAP
jgi:hypothetical protein